MTNPYESNYGTSFGFAKTQTAGMKPICKGLYTDAHSFRDFGLYPTEKPIITTPEIQSSEIEVTGRDGTIDTTETLDGMPHYFNREGTFKFSAVGGRHTWGTIYAKLKNRLHGKVKNIIIDEEKDGYYRGRLTVEEPEYDPEKGVAYFEITANLEPFKYDFTTTVEPWLWDPFSFITGVIRNYSAVEVNNSSVTVYGSKIPIVPNIKVTSGSLSVTYTNADGQSKTVALSNDSGGNIENTPDLILKDESPVVLQFTGSGTIQIEFQTGVL